MGWRRSCERAQRLKRLCEITGRGVTGGAYFSKKKRRIVRYYVSGYPCAGYLRRQANRAVRRARDVPGGEYNCGNGERFSTKSCSIELLGVKDEKFREAAAKLFEQLRLEYCLLFSYKGKKLYYIDREQGDIL